MNASSSQPSVARHQLLSDLLKCSIDVVCCIVSSFTLHACRYSYDISFVGREVIGNVDTLSIDEAACSSFDVAGGGDAEVSVQTLNDGDAVGTSTTVQRVKVCIL